MAFVTSVVGGIAIFLYLKKRRDERKDAAKVILQEIRRAEDVIQDYRKFGSFKFTRRVIATNSWGKNLHLFADNLELDEIDKISDLYSMGEYLDRLIGMVSDIKFDERIKQRILDQARGQVQGQMEKYKNEILQFAEKTNHPFEGSVILPQQVIDSGNIPISAQVNKPLDFNVNVRLAYDSVPVEELFKQIINEYEPIYSSKIVQKLERIVSGSFLI